MYPNLQKSEEKCFQISFNPHQQIIPEDLISVEAEAEAEAIIIDNNNGVIKNLRIPRKKKKVVESGNLNNNNDFEDQDHQIKLMHRERERQRRQEMGSLCMSLRTLLPLEFIKGKRAISDQMNGAVNYIKHQKKKIKEIEERRDELKRSRGQSCSLKMRSFDGGVVEILITTNGFFHGFPVSRILKVVVEQAGLEVITCASTTIDNKSIHTIQIQVSDSSSLDLPQLGKKLTEAMPLLRQVTD